jgi:hypothetical protein
MTSDPSPTSGAASLRQLRARYYEANGIPPDGGQSQRWIRATSGRLPLYFRNTAPRRTFRAFLRGRRCQTPVLAPLLLPVGLLMQ